MGRRSYAFVFILCNLGIARTYLRGTHIPGSWQIVAALVFLLCLLIAYGTRRRCKSVGVQGWGRNALIALSLLPIIQWIPFAYLMWKKWQ